MPYRRLLLLLWVSVSSAVCSAQGTLPKNNSQNTVPVAEKTLVKSWFRRQDWPSGPSLHMCFKYIQEGDTDYYNSTRTNKKFAADYGGLEWSSKYKIRPAFHYSRSFSPRHATAHLWSRCSFSIRSGASSDYVFFLETRLWTDLTINASFSGRWTRALPDSQAFIQSPMVGDTPCTYQNMYYTKCTHVSYNKRWTLV